MCKDYIYIGGRGSAKPFTTLNAICLHQENIRLRKILQSIKDDRPYNYASFEEMVKALQDKASRSL